MSSTIHLYTICWNEEFMLPYFFQHYDHVVDRYIFYDDGSTDNTPSILSNHPNVEIRTLPRLDVDSYVLAAREMHNNFWKESIGKVDWVIYSAVDEFLYTPNFSTYLSKCTEKGITAIPALGFQMISEELPVKDKPMLSQIRTGCPWNEMNKLSIFNPNEISETNFSYGRHMAGLKGNIVFPEEDVLFNLHYKYLNFEKTFERHCELQQKLGEIDKENNWGYQYGWSLERFKEEWNRYKNKSQSNIFTRQYNPDIEHSLRKERWWRANE